MNKLFVAALALAAAISKPAAAITFPSLTTIYVASGVEDDGSADNAGTATSIHCSNVSGVTTQIRIVVLNTIGAVEGTLVFSAVPHAFSLRASTHFTFYVNETSLATGQVANGVINVESTQSGVFCTFAVVNAAGPVDGLPLNAVRVNPHPGTVE